MTRPTPETLVNDWGATSTGYAMVVGLTGPKGPVIRKVKNLGWLLRHAGEVERLTVFKGGVNPDGAVLVADLKLDSQGKREVFYSASFASYTVCRDWLAKRRVFQGVPTVIHDHGQWRAAEMGL